MSNSKIYTIFNLGFATIWLINGFFCKVLNLVPRHELIVSSILGAAHARLFTVLIGFSEVLMAIWILSRYQTKLNAITQIVIITTMNTLEFILVPDLLLWGKFNSIFAGVLVLTICLNEFIVNKKSVPAS